MRVGLFAARKPARGAYSAVSVRVVVAWCCVVFVVVLLWCVAADVNQSCFHAQLVKGAYNGGS